MPKPSRQPIGVPGAPLKRRSAQRTGPGFTASNHRNNANAIAWASGPAGAISQSTIQNATTSSQTTAAGSRCAKCCAARVHAHQPNANDAASTSVGGGGEVRGSGPGSGVGSVEADLGDVGRD